jgi:hypothetical protein
VDRLTAIYQAIFPSSTIEPLVRTQPNLGYPERGGIEDIDTLLYPFRHADGKEWTSRDVSSAESIHKYGYSYPEVPSGLSKEKLTAFASKEMQKLYAPDTDTDNFHKSPGGASVRTEWLAHVKYDQNQIAGTFNIMMYIGDVPNAPEGRVAVDTLVGTCTSFSGPQKLEYNSTIAGTVPLTPALVNKNLKPANRKEIVEYLRRNLHWKIMRVCSTVPCTSSQNTDMHDY